WGSTIVFRHYFVGISVREYYLLHLMYACVTAAGCATSLCLCRMLVPAEGIRELMLRFGICLIVPNLIYLVVYRHTRIYREAMPWLRHVLGRRS
ncbi:MAG: hypothetical protein IJT34_08900, partial [Butyrivibrio sp.]|nr:hypothetical protein [Butyrivibrio sp.]